MGNILDVAWVRGYIFGREIVMCGLYDPTLLQKNTLVCQVEFLGTVRTFETSVTSMSQHFVTHLILRKLWDTQVEMKYLLL